MKHAFELHYQPCQFGEDFRHLAVLHRLCHQRRRRILTASPNFGPYCPSNHQTVTKTPDLIIFLVLQERNFGKSDFVVSEHGKWLKLHP